MKKLKTLALLIPTAIGVFLANFAAIPGLSTSTLAGETLTSSSSSSNSVAAIARQVTVRLLGKTIGGSGAIVRREGQTYFVLTCAHVLSVVEDSDDLRAIAPDGRSYQATPDTRSNFGNLDLTVVRFKSSKNYKVAALGDYENLDVNSPTYVSGFPNYQYVGQNDWLNTHSLGRRAYRYTSGQVLLLLKQSMEKGYQLGLSNDVDSGMSGGPVLNQQGQLIGIIGRMGNITDNPEAYLFADGTQPSEELLEQMVVASWAIPITYFHSKILK